MITVLIVDDQAMVRGGLRLILEAEDDINVIAEAETVKKGCVSPGGKNPTLS